MKKVVFLLIMVSILIFGKANADNYLYVINSMAQTLSKIDIDNSTVWNHILTLDLVPNDIKVRGDSAYVLNSVGDDIQIIDLTDDAEVGRIEFHTNGNPWEMSFYGDYIYVSNYLNGKVYEVESATGNITKQIQVGNTLEGILVAQGKVFTTDINYNPDNYTFGDGVLYYSDLPNLGDWDSLKVGTNPQKMIIGPDGNLHIVCTGDYISSFGVVYIVDPNSVSIVDSIVIGGSPASAVVTADNYVLLGAGGWVDNGEVYCYNGMTGEVLNGSDNPIQTGLGTMGVAADDNGNGYCCNFSDGTVNRIDSNRQIAGTYLVGDGPNVAAFYNSDMSSVDNNETIPKKIELNLTAYPNPFNDEANISFDIPNNEWVRLEVYNLFGEKVGVLFSGRMEKGRHTIKWDAGGCSSGIYLCRLSAGFYISTVKINLLK